MDDCPLDAVEQLRSALNRFPYPKVGLGLYVGDLPAGLDPGIFMWERGPMICGESLAPDVYVSAVDTTFALYRPGGAFTYMAMRLHAPYEARHLGWYAEVEPTEEDLYYLAHADKGSEASSRAARCR